MARQIHLAVNHDLGIAGAKEAITERFAIIKRDYIDKIGSADLTWDGATGTVKANALGQKAEAAVVVGETEITIDITLPWLLAGMAGTIESVLKGNKDALQRPAAKSD